MNLTELFEMQRRLDKEIDKKRNNINPQFTKKEITLQRMIALMVEAGEYINEVQSFKYWKQNKNLVCNKIHEEFADLLHFFITISYEYGIKPEFTPYINEYHDINIQFKELFISIAEMMKDINAINIRKAFEIALGSFLLLGYTYEEMFQAYFFKNQLNYKRLYTNY
ncbi:dUTP diphosphatase [Mycoplasmopsis edwardii]|uniref:dUTP diphosphatase n=1 Tax=Mycoplasmopsis edwardii TaxID=53558 RepID=A0ACD4PGX7_9BACT|nr:dUTP diphosphatase [Mycoplasmopsis edwardii]WBP83896.1 dUTP diphosphatase [Mycoplasmopsis edwardii]